MRVNKEVADSVETWEEYKEIEDENLRNGNPFPAQPEIQHIAFEMRRNYLASKAKLLREAEWHMPYVSDETIGQIMQTYAAGTCIGKSTTEFLLPFLLKVSMGRCARVSYLNHGENNTPEKDIDICEKLIQDRHMSPTEHVATPAQDKNFYGNFRGWKQYRKSIDGESGEN